MAATNTTTTAAAAPPANTAPAAVDGTTPTATAGRPDGAAGAIWDALTTTPGATIPAIARAAGVARAVAKTELMALVAAGHVTRTAGGRGDNGRALPDTWTPVTAPAAPATATPPVTDADQATDTDGDTDKAPNTQTGGDTATDNETAPAAPVAPAVTAETIADAMAIMREEADRRAKAEADLKAKVAEEEERRNKILAELAKARTAEDTRRALTDLLAAVTNTYAAVVADDEAATAAGLERIFASTDMVRLATGAAPARTARAVRTGAGSGGGVARSGDRAAPRPLRPEVIAHLAAHPGKDFTPGEIAKVLDRSSGAVANALDTLVKKGEAAMTNEHPARYSAMTPATADTDTADTPAPDGSAAAVPATQDPATATAPAATVDNVADGADAPEAA